MRSVGVVLDESRGLGKGFDFLRVALALGVVIWHAPTIAGAYTWADQGGVVWLGSYLILIMFFGLSGFLIAGSAIRLNLKNFLINRGLRIFPALAVEVILSALILGPIFTKLPLSEYFTSRSFFTYFTNLLGKPNYYLPGVFNGTWVNGSLWTVPFEIACYAVISVLIYFGLVKRAVAPLGIGVLLLVIQGCLVASSLMRPEQDYGFDFKGQVLTAVDSAFYDRGSRLVVSFCFGIVAYTLRYRIPYSWIIAFTCCLFMLGVQSAAQWHTERSPLANIFLVAPAVYVMIVVGLANIPELPFFHKGDYSYGIYLYGWPVAQAFRYAMPSYTSNPWMLLAITLIPTIAFAALSWHWIELPILHLRRKFSFVARQRLAEAGPSPELAGASQNYVVTNAEHPN